MTGMFAFASPFMGCLAEAIDKRILILCGFIGLTGSVFLTGGLADKSEQLTFIGLGLNGIFVAAIFAPVIPEVVSTMQADFE